jgi:hypothetical protein
LVNQRGHHTPSGASRFRTVAAAVSFACGDVHQRGYRYRSGIFSVNEQYLTTKRSA